MTTTPGLGKLELAVLMAVARLGDEAYGLGIRHEVSLRRKHDYSVGSPNGCSSDSCATLP
jgi:hypothetical protein